LDARDIFDGIDYKDLFPEKWDRLSSRRMRYTQVIYPNHQRQSNKWRPAPFNTPQGHISTRSLGR